MMTPQKETELRRNFEEFKKILPTIVDAHESEYALMRNGEILDYYVSASKALKAGIGRFDDELFSVQEVRTNPADFGWFSRVPIDGSF